MLHKYKNGDFDIEIYKDGTKKVIGEGKPKYPISMDIKITNYCDAGCLWCHEKSTIKGKHGNILKYLDLFGQLPNGTELAIGGGNPLSHPDLKKFLFELKNYLCLIPNITINSFHLKQEIIKEILGEKLIYGLGVSYNPVFKEDIKNIDYENMVVHMIAGINTFEQMKEMLENGKKILILGYKQWGRGEKYYNEIIEKNIKELYQKLNQLFGKGLVSFDNLAIKQLNPKRFFTKEKYEQRYMGDDGSFTMYMDLVEEKYGINSIAPNRFKIEGSMEQIFNKVFNF